MEDGVKKRRRQVHHSLLCGWSGGLLASCDPLLSLHAAKAQADDKRRAVFKLFLQPKNQIFQPCE